MIYIHYCPACSRVHILNGHKTVCPVCDRRLKELRISYMQYIEMNRAERKLLQHKLSDPKELNSYVIDYNVWIWLAYLIMLTNGRASH